MLPETRELVRALSAVNQQMPRLVTELLAGSLPSVRQHSYATLLVELGELLHQHADITNVPDATADPDDAPSS